MWVTKTLASWVCVSRISSQLWKMYIINKNNRHMWTSNILSPVVKRQGGLLLRTASLHRSQRDSSVLSRWETMAWQSRDLAAPCVSFQNCHRVWWQRNCFGLFSFGALDSQMFLWRIWKQEHDTSCNLENWVKVVGMVKLFCQVGVMLGWSSGPAEIKGNFTTEKKRVRVSPAGFKSQYL